MTKEAIKEIKENLTKFTGTKNYHQYYGDVHFSDGIKYLTEVFKFNWFLSLIEANTTNNDKVKDENFKVYKFTKFEDSSAIVEITNYSGELLDEQKIGITDFPLDSLTIYCIDRLMLLPTESFKKVQNYKEQTK